MPKESPNYLIGNHPWPAHVLLPSGYTGLGLSDGEAYFTGPSGEILTVPASTISLSTDSGYFAGLIDLLVLNGTFFTIIETFDTNTFSNIQKL
jgi:hypothetical protein